MRPVPGDGSQPTLWSRVADLPLTIDAHVVRPIPAPSAQDRASYLIALRGGGGEGLGEEVGGDMLDKDGAFLAAAPSLPLAGDWTLATFCDHVAGLDLWAEPPEWDGARRFRRWAFESAALDLALAQAAIGLAEALDRTPAPVRFVNSLGLGDPPEYAAVGRRLERCPGLRFKLDAQASWSPSLAAEVAATGTVDVIDFKGRYDLPVADDAALVTMYETVLDRFPDALLEDPHDRPEVAALVAPHAARVSFDAPIVSPADIAEAQFGARTVNVKPSRIGSVRTLLDVYEHCEREGVRMYGGGMGELGVARGQIELLAALFHPDGPNDVAPTPYNLPDLPDGLPQSPMQPHVEVTGFRWS